MKNAVITVLAVLVLAMGGYLVYDKIIDKDDKIEDNNKTNDNQNENNNEQISIKQENAAFFDEYLAILLPRGSANNFKENLDTFTDENLTKFLYFYFMGNEDAGSYNSADGYITYTVTKEECDEVIYKYFGISDYEIVSPTGRSGIRKLRDGIYQVFWFETGWMAPEAQNTGVKYDGINVTVEYTLTEDTYGPYGENSKLIFHLVYNEGNYNVKSIEYKGI